MSVHPGHETLRELRAGKVVSLDGQLFVMAEGKLAAGDTYIGARNTVDVYTCKLVNTRKGWVEQEGDGYLFDTHECVKVKPTRKRAKPDYVVPSELIASNVHRKMRTK